MYVSSTAIFHKVHLFSGLTRSILVKLSHMSQKLFILLVLISGYIILKNKTELTILTLRQDGVERTHLYPIRASVAGMPISPA